MSQPIAVPTLVPLGVDAEVCDGEVCAVPATGERKLVDEPVEADRT